MSDRQGDKMKAEVPTQWGNEKRHWHLDKTVSITHIISTLAIAGSVFLWATALEKKVDRNAQAIEFLLIQQQNERDKLETMRGEIRQDFNSVNNKLDRIIERTK